MIIGLVLVLMACGTPVPSGAVVDTTASPDGPGEIVDPTATSGPSVVAPSVGRSVCPGSAPTALEAITGAPATRLEELQGTYENDPGFLAVIFDGVQVIVVVESDMRLQWQTRLAGVGIRVASSCVDPRLVASIPEALRLINERTGRTMSAGYDSLDDAFLIAGVLPDELVRTLDEIGLGIGAVAQAAITAGTVRIMPGMSGGQRL